MKTLAFALTLLFATNPAVAQPPAAEARTVEVPYSDLDLSRAEGRATLDRRLRAAARQVCRQLLAYEPLAPYIESGCRRSALAEARESAALAAAEAETRVVLARASASQR